MIEPLVDTAPEEVEGAQPLQQKLAIKDITFRDDKLWQPLYGSLIDYSRVRDTQVEPAFQIRTKRSLEVEIEIEIQEGQSVTFVREDGEDDQVKCRTIAQPTEKEIPGLVTARWVDERRCTLIWRQSEANDQVRDHYQDMERRKEVTVLRIFCQGGSLPPRENPEFERESALAQVEGGLYLAILYNPRDNAPVNVKVRTPNTSHPLPPPPPPSKPEVSVIGIDQGRAVYDLFRPSPASIPPELELEPAFRVREGEMAELDLILDISGMRWRADERNEAMVTPFLAESRPRQLQTTRASGEDGHVCEIRWHQEADRSSICQTGNQDATCCYCTTGYVSSFLFTAIPFGDRLEDILRENPSLSRNPRKTLSAVAIDPTVIELPTCTPEGVCIPPGGGRPQ